MKQLVFIYTVLFLVCNVAEAQNVGIGTTTPAYKLDLAGQQRITGPATAAGGSNTTNQTSGTLRLRNTNAPFSTNLVLDAVSLQSETIDNSTFPSFYFPQDFSINPYGGNVGIGTAIPQYAKLQIHGRVGATVAMFGADAFGVGISANNPEIGFNYFFNGGTYTIKAGYGANLGMNPGNGDVYIGNFSGNQSAADFGPITGYQNCVTIKQNGNVGIGTANPTFRLSVNGNIRSKEVIVETGWADYVFDKKYKLLPLQELETYIQQHKHLPGIPSAAEINTQGLKLGEVQTKMMEKIEELTLYVIELKKENEELKTMIKALNRQ